MLRPAYRRMALVALVSMGAYLLSSTLALAAGPQVTITSPKKGSAVSGLARVEVETAGEAKFVTIFIDDVLRAMTNIQPFSYLWSTTRFQNGSHKIQARAFDSANNLGLSPIVEVYVNNPVGATQLLTPPPAATSSLAATTPVSPAPLGNPLRASASRAASAPRQATSGLVAAESAQLDGLLPSPPSALPAPASAAKSAAAPKPTGPAVAQRNPQPAATRIARVPRTESTGTEMEGRVILSPPPTPAAAVPEPLRANARAAAMRPAEAVAATRGERTQSKMESSSISKPTAPEAAVVLPVRVSSRTAAVPASATGSAIAESVAPTRAAAVEAKPSAPRVEPLRVAPNAGLRVATLPAPKTESAPAAKQEFRVAMLPRPKIEAAPAAAPVAPEPRPATYTVKPGDSLWLIARRADTHVSAIIAANGLDPEKQLQLGQKLLIPRLQVYAENQAVESDVSPYISAGTSMAPFRAVVQNRGGQVNWAGSKQEATARTARAEIKVRVGSRQAQVNKKPVLMSRPAEMRSQRTLVPLRFLTNALDLTVRYEPEKSALRIEGK